MKILVKYLLSMFLISLTSAGLMAQSDDMMKARSDGGELTEQEFEQFATTVIEIGTIQQEVQTEMVQVINESGLETNRFNELAQAKFNPNQEKEIEASEEEMARFENVLAIIQPMQTEMQSAITETIHANGFTMQRYQEVAGMVNTDPEWQQRLQHIMEENNN
jgi:hypothetical protein